MATLLVRTAAPFSCRRDIHWVELATGSHDADHCIRPEDRIRIARGRQ